MRWRVTRLSHSAFFPNSYGVGAETLQHHYGAACVTICYIKSFPSTSTFKLISTNSHVMFALPTLHPFTILPVVLAISLIFLSAAIMERGKMLSHAKHIKFHGSQIGSQATIPLPYTDSPLTLLRSDILAALRFYLFLPFIIMPLRPQLSGSLSELYPSASNLWSMFLHLILVCMQLPFILSIPFWVFFPVWSVLIGVGIFWVINRGIWHLLNGKDMATWSEAKFTTGKEVRKNEQWIFLNGVAVGYVLYFPFTIIQFETNNVSRKHWLQSNVNRIALTFGRPVLGVHNKTFVLPLNPHHMTS